MIPHLEAVFQFQPDFGIFAVDGELAAIGMEKVVAEGGMQLVVKSIVGTEAIEDTTIGDVDVGEGLEGKGVVKQVLRGTEGGKTCVAMLTLCDVFMGILSRERPIVAGIPVETDEGIGGCSASNALRLVEIFSELAPDDELACRDGAIGAQHRHAAILADAIAEDGHLVPSMEGRQREVDAAKEERETTAILHITQTTAGLIANGDRSN